MQYFFNLHAVRGAYQESLNHFHEVFRPDGSDYLSLAKAEALIDEHGARLEHIRRLEQSHIFDPQADDTLQRERVVEDTLAVAVDATTIRHKNGEEMELYDEKGRKKRLKGFKEAKIGAIGEIERDEQSQSAKCVNLSYVAGIENADDFFRRVYVEKCRRTRKDVPLRVVALGDGAPWIWNRMKELVSEEDSLVCVLDFWHAREHLLHAAKILFGESSKKYGVHLSNWESFMYDGRIDDVIVELRERRKKLRGEKRKAIKREIIYFETNTSKMKYDEYRKKCLPIGSGAVESACKNVIGGRLKGAGMLWSKQGADSMLAVRTSYKNGTFREDFRKALRLGRRWHERMHLVA